MVQKEKEYQANLEGSVFTLEELNLRSVASRHSSRPVSQKSVLTVVKHKKSTRVAIDQEVIEKIGSPERVQIALNQDGIAIGVGFPGDDNYFPLMKAANKAVIYSSPLVTELTKAFELDFSNVSSISFQDVKYMKIESQNVAFVNMVRNVSKLELGDEADGDSSEDAELRLDDDADGDGEDVEFDADDEADSEDDDSELDPDDDADGEDDDLELDLDGETDSEDDDLELGPDDETDSEDDDLELDPDDETDSGDDDGEDSEKFQPFVLTRRRHNRS